MARKNEPNIKPMVSGGKVVGRIKRSRVARPIKLGKGGNGVSSAKRSTR